MKVVNKLTRAELVESSRGVNGGLILARPASDITVGEVVQKCEDDLGLVECFRTDNQCAITPECELKNVFGHALNEFMDVLDRYTIADLVAPRAKLRSRLRISA
jgi:Rrf2 family nitric oxide-sensitive transcriptional repressor